MIPTFAPRSPAVRNPRNAPISAPAVDLDEESLRELWGYAEADARFTWRLGALVAWRARMVGLAQRAEAAYVEDGILPLALETRWEPRP